VVAEFDRNPGGIDLTRSIAQYRSQMSVSISNSLKGLVLNLFWRGPRKLDQDE
jgi:hypothetical protein